MTPVFRAALLPLLCAAPLAAQTAAAPPNGSGPPDTSRAAVRPAAPAPNGCTIPDITKLRRNPTPSELRCRYRARGPGRFGLLSYLDVPVYQPRTPQPGTHIVGVPGMPHPLPGESYEQWEWRVLRSTFGPGVRGVHREMQLLDPVFASRLVQFERELRARGVRAVRRETWRSPERQAYFFQQGRSRPGPISTTTLTSWHNRVDRMGRPAARAADYEVAPRDLPLFHQIAAQVGIEGYGADSNDPGHVYLPDTDAAAGMEIAVLRLLPRVPHVTLETGRPSDETPIPGMPNYWRELTSLFLSRWVAFPAVEVRPVPTPRLTALRAPKLPPPPPPPAPRGRRGRRH
ncbi:hypothetical protein [Longimicrobium sp.]|uniref:hypothetical protein n=1 Tax=Longimicrobium sp. TaxID=2029185 RepID=UPI002D18AD58|nr:hypothetical protein [Longimicrobium sp.]HSU14708.1 hypothetical protein [Longimicrobium sp.]